MRDEIVKLDIIDIRKRWLKTRSELDTKELADAIRSFFAKKYQFEDSA
ncbi:MAG: hypothetical protein QXL15_02180 [Candidatus Korarchaeota archaeon]